MKKEERQQVINNLFSSNNNEVKQSLSIIREKGDNIMLKAVTELFNYIDDEEIISEIFLLLSELKKEDSVVVLSEAVEKSKINTKKLIEACWMTGLNFAEFINIFINAFVSQNLDVSIEAYTLITTTDFRGVEINKIQEAINLLEKKTENIRSEKKQLATDIVHILSSHI